MKGSEPPADRMHDGRSLVQLWGDLYRGDFPASPAGSGLLFGHILVLLLGRKDQTLGLTPLP